MKKVLLGTTALAAMLAASAHAESPRVTVGGFLDFQAGWSDQDWDAAGSGTTTRDIKFQNDTEVYVSVDGKADNGLGYGAVIELEADVSADADGEGLNADKTYVYLDGNWGRFEMGANAAPAETMRVDTSNFARATGGAADGDWYDFINLAPGGTVFVSSADLPIAHGGLGGAFGSLEDSTKITYYSPRFSGLQLGVSFSPDSADVGTAAGWTGEADGSVENVFSTGLNYNGQYDNVGIMASLTGEWGESEVAGMEDLSAYAVGLGVNFDGFTLGGSYGDWDDSLQVTGSNTNADFWNLGAAYDFGPFGSSLTYFSSENGNNELQNITLGADYQMAPGMVPYVEVNFFELDTGAAAIADNDGTVLLVGTELSF